MVLISLIINLLILLFAALFILFIVCSVRGKLNLKTMFYSKQVRLAFGYILIGWFTTVGWALASYLEYAVK